MFLYARQNTVEADRLLESAMSIPELFDFVETRSRSDPRAKVDLALDPTYGFPTHFGFDNPDRVDEEHAFRVYDFTVVQ